MPTRCVAVGCPNTYETPGISFHTFPKCEETRTLWLQALNRRDKWRPTNTSTVCSAHFRREDFEHDPRLESQVSCRIRRKLKPDVVPSLFALSGLHERSRAARAKYRRVEVWKSALVPPSERGSLTDAVDSNSREEAHELKGPGVSFPVGSKGTCIRATSKYAQVEWFMCAASKGTQTTGLFRNCGTQTEGAAFELYHVWGS
ncbi:peroxynitrite isomerase THAP4-like isoform X2 [Haemaphysalis longicornis]